MSDRRASDIWHDEAVDGQGLMVKGPADRTAFRHDAVRQLRTQGRLCEAFHLPAFEFDIGQDRRRATIGWYPVWRQTDDRKVAMNEAAGITLRAPDAVAT